jgi:spermidine synthase
LYTKEYFSYIKKILKPGGVLAIWVQLASPAYEKVLYNTLKSQFTEVTIRLPSKETESKPGYFNFFASDEKKVFPKVESEIENKIIQTVENYPLEEINTLDKPALIKYFEINKVFSLPDYYTEPFYSPDTAK